MKRVAMWAGAALIILLALSLTRGAHSASAQSGGGYDLSWNTIDAGGGASTGGAYALTGSLGQPDAGSLLGGQYTLNGGFWAVPVNLARLFLPLIRR